MPLAPGKGVGGNSIRKLILYPISPRPFFPPHGWDRAFSPPPPLILKRSSLPREFIELLLLLLLLLPLLLLWLLELLVLVLLLLLLLSRTLLLTLQLPLQLSVLRLLLLPPGVRKKGASCRL